MFMGILAVVAMIIRQGTSSVHIYLYDYFILDGIETLKKQQK